MKPTLRNKLIIFIIIIAAFCFGAAKFVIKPINGKIENLKNQKAELQALKADISPLLEQSKKLKEEDDKLNESVRNIRELSGGETFTKEEFLVFLGDSSKENNVSVTGFSDIAFEQTDGVYKAVFDFELRGASVDINKVLEDIEATGIKCSYGSLSFRQNAKYNYLLRFFDAVTELPWYKEEENEDESQKPDEEIQEGIAEFFETIPFDLEGVPSEEPSKEEIPESIPEQETMPEITPEQIPETNPESKDENINDRINNLLMHTKYIPHNYEIKLLENKETKNVQEMRLAVTVCFVMFNEPTAENSFLLKAEV